MPTPKQYVAPEIDTDGTARSNPKNTYFVIWKGLTVGRLKQPNIYSVLKLLLVANGSISCICVGKVTR